MMAAKKLLIGNWKLNHTKVSAEPFLNALVQQFSSSDVLDLAVAPVATLLDFCSTLLRDSAVGLCAQNVFYENSGAYTGEWSVDHLVELGVKFCIVGHSERRRLFGETDEMVAKKTKACFKAGVVPVVCVGESQAERDANTTNRVIEAQVRTVLDALAEQESETNLIFAYEPIWAIGTGVSADRAQVQQVHEHIRDVLCKNFRKGGAKSVRILYGGSVSPQNIREIVSIPDVDGALVGGASLQVETFLSMVRELGREKIA